MAVNARRINRTFAARIKRHVNVEARVEALGGEGSALVGLRRFATVGPGAHQFAAHRGREHETRLCAKFITRSRGE